MELFSYQTRSGWLPRLSLLPCSLRCKCNLLHPLSWHLLLPILNHPRWGCTYHPFQGQCRYCSRGGKKRKRYSKVHITYIWLYNLRGLQISFWTLGFYLRKRPAVTQQKLGDQKSCPACLWEHCQYFHSFCLPQLSASPYICFLKKATYPSDDNACFFILF